MSGNDRLAGVARSVRRTLMLGVSELTGQSIEFAVSCSTIEQVMLNCSELLLVTVWIYCAVTVTL